MPHSAFRSTPQGGALKTGPFVPKTYVCWKEGYTKKLFLGDLFAGLTVGVVALPLAMAFAIASGVTPERGLYTAFIGGFLISLLSGSRVQVGGPTGAFVVIILGVVQRQGIDGLIFATFLAGLILVGFGLLRLGYWIKFIPYPVTTGFTSGIALIIFSSQVKEFLGLKLEAVPSEFIEKWWAYLAHLHTIDWPTLAVGAGALALILGFRRYAPRVPGPVVAVIATSVVVGLFQIPVETIGSRFGGIPSSLPSFAWPAISLGRFRDLMPDALTIAFLAGIESLLCAVVADGMIGGRHKSNAELVSQGVGNIACSLFGGIPATGAIARTATNVKFGGRTPVAGLIHALTVLVFILFLAPAAKFIPMAALAAILFVVAWNMAEIDHFRGLLRAPRSDVAVLLSTFFLTILVDLTVAVEVGVVLAALTFMKRMSDVTQVGDMVGVDRPERPIDDPDAIEKKNVPAGVEVYEINGPFFFGVADRLKDTLAELERPPKVFILRMRHVPSVDASGIHALKEFHHKCGRDGTQLVLSGVRPNVAAILRKSGFSAILGPEHIHDHINKALAHAARLVEPK